MITDFFADTSAAVTASAAAGFVALLSLANPLGAAVRLWVAVPFGSGSPCRSATACTS